MGTVEKVPRGPGYHPRYVDSHVLSLTLRK